MKTVDELLTVLDGIAPLSTAEEWDNAGFQVGDLEASVTKALVCLDVTEAALAKAQAIGAELIISHHPLSKKELAGKLADRGYTENEIGEAMEKLGEYGMVDDAAYAAAITERAAGKNMSRRALLFELNRRGIDKDTALAAAEELPDPADALDALVETRMKGAVPDRSLNEKTYRYLAGKGFAPGEIRGALRRYAMRRGGEWADDD